MKWFLNGIMAMCLCGMLAGCGGQAPENQGVSMVDESVDSSALAQELSEGHLIFQNNCMSCHTLTHIQNGPIHHFIAEENATLVQFTDLLRHGSDDSGYMRQFSVDDLSDDRVQVLYQWLVQQSGAPAS